MGDAAKNVCGLCCHCCKGLEYGKFYFLCVYCNLSVCNRCYNQHPQDHRPGFRRCKDRMLATDAPAQGISCSECHKEAEIRMECNACDVKICMDCWPKIYSHFEGHEHKAFTFVRAPHEYTLDHFDRDCGSCLLGSTMLHCGRCLEGIMEGEKTYECLSCLKILGSCMNVCESCLPIAKAEHSSTHEWLSVVFREVKKVEETYIGGRCDECGEKVPLTTETKISHPHKQFALEMGCIERQGWAHRSLRNCMRHPVRDVFPNAADLHSDMGCQCCWEKFRKDSEIYVCLKCGKVYCSDCETSGRLNHPHPVFKVQLRRPTAPEDLWKSIAAGGGRRSCDACHEDFIYEAQSHMRCTKCMNYDICNDCIAKTSTSVKHACGDWPEFIWFDTVEPSQEWVDAQSAKVDAFRAEEEAKAALEEAKAAAAKRVQEEAAADKRRREAEAATAAAAAKKMMEESAARKKMMDEGARKYHAEMANTTRLAPQATPRITRAPSPSPAPTRLAPPRQAQPRRPKSSSGLGSLFKGALQVTGALLNVENQIQNGGGGGGGYVVPNNSGGGMDMSSFWGPINAAASAPIQ